MLVLFGYTDLLSPALLSSTCITFVLRVSPPVQKSALAMVIYKTP